MSGRVDSHKLSFDLHVCTHHGACAHACTHNTPPHTHIHPCALGSPLANLSSFRQAHILLSSDLQFMVCLHLLPPRRRYQRTNLDCCQHCGFVSQIRAWSLLSPTGWNKEGAVMVSPGPKPSLDLCMYCNCVHRPVRLLSTDMHSCFSAPAGSCLLYPGVIMAPTFPL